MFNFFLPILYITISVFFFNCASGTIIVDKKPDSSFNKYPAIQILVNDGGVVNGAEIGKRIQTLVISKLSQKVKSEIFTAESPTDKKVKDFLKLTMKFLNYKDVTPLQRQMVGALAGRANVKFEGELLDTKTNLVISKFTVEETSSGGTAFAGTTEDIIDPAATKVADFIIENAK